MRDALQQLLYTPTQVTTTRSGFARSEERGREGDRDGCHCVLLIIGMYQYKMDFTAI